MVPLSTPLFLCCQKIGYDIDMKRYDAGFTVTALFIIVGILFAGGGAYIYNEQIKDSADDRLLSSVRDRINSSRPTMDARQIAADLAWAKTRLRMETDKLSVLKAEAREAQLQFGIFADESTKIRNIITSKTNRFFTDAMGTNPKIIFQDIDANTIQRINALRAEVNRIIREGITYVDIPIINTYISELDQIVDSLIPDEDFTETDKDDFSDIIEQAYQDVGDIVDDFVDDQTDDNEDTNDGDTGTDNQSDSNTQEGSTDNNSDNSDDPIANESDPPSIIDEIQEQLDIIDDLEDEIEELEQIQEQLQQEDGQDQSDEDINDGNVIPPFTVPNPTITPLSLPIINNDTSGKPKLIQGTNSADD